MARASSTEVTWGTTTPWAPASSARWISQRSPHGMRTSASRAACLGCADHVLQRFGAHWTVFLVDDHKVKTGEPAHFYNGWRRRHDETADKLFRCPQAAFEGSCHWSATLQSWESPMGPGPKQAAGTGLRIGEMAMGSPIRLTRSSARRLGRSRSGSGRRAAGERRLVR